MKRGSLHLLSIVFVLASCQLLIGQQSGARDTYVRVDNDGGPSSRTTNNYTFDEIMSIPSEYDDNFSFAVIGVSIEQKALIARNYIRSGSRQDEERLREQPDRQSIRLFTLDSGLEDPAHLSDSTTFGFIPNSSLAYLMTCFDKVKIWDTETQEKLEVEFPHAVANECAGPGPAISPDGRIMATQTEQALRFWDLQTFEPITPELAKDWSWDLHFTTDGKWFMHREEGDVNIRDPETGELVAGPFRHDLNEEGFAYDSETQRLATIENNGRNNATWNSTLVIRSRDDWSGARRIELSGHTREVHWVTRNHLLVVSDEKYPDREPPYTYGRNTVTLVSLDGRRPLVEAVERYSWIPSVSVSRATGHFLVQTREWVKCWSVDHEEPLWTKPPADRINVGSQEWIVLQQGRTTLACSIDTGRVFRRWSAVETSRVDGETIWLCKESGVEVWRATLDNEPKPIFSP